MELPDLLGRASLRGTVVAIVATVALVTLPTTPAVAGSSACRGADVVPTARTLGQARSATICLVNRERVERGLGRLRTNRSLQASASSYARQMVRGSFFDHVTPSGETLTERIREDTRYLANAHGWEIGENLAWGTGSQATPEKIVRGWMNSPGHRRNILHARFREMGLGIALGTPVEASAAAGAATYANHFGRRG